MSLNYRPATPKQDSKEALMNVICGQFTSDKYLGENLDCSPVNVISIRYTGAPLVFCTGSHSSEIEVKFLFVTTGMLGFGGKEPSPANMEEKFCNCAKNVQLFKQLICVILKEKGNSNLHKWTA